MATTAQLPEIEVESRDQMGSRPSMRLRAAGRLPAVIYGHKQDPVHVTMDQKQFTDLLHRQTHLLEVSMGSSSESCLIKDVQWNHLGSEILHVDLTRVDLTERVTVNVQLELAGEAVGLKETGAILEHPLSEIEIGCEAANIPASIRVDVSGLEVAGSIYVRDIEFPEGVVPETDPDTVIASIRVLAEEAEEEPIAETTEGEPEVIGRKEEEPETPDAG